MTNIIQLEKRAKQKARTPLTDAQIMDALPFGILDCLNDPWDEGKGDRDTMHSIKTDVLRVARAIEAAHNINGEIK